MAGYDFTAIERKWQEYWEKHGTFVQPNPGEKGFVDRPKLYVLDMFPYPSGHGLHVGHPEGYTATDIVARHARMKGYNVLHPMGYDSFGLPAQQYAVEHGIHPRITTQRNIDNIERQIKMFGFSYDWSRRVATTDPNYYRWTQWIFLQMFNSWYDPEAGAARPISELEDKLIRNQLVVDVNGGLHPVSFVRKIPEFSLMSASFGDLKFTELDPDQRRRLIDEYRLAYMDEVPVNWCPMLGTVLANEEVTNEGRSDRGDFPVYRRALKQWMLRITAYADRLLADLDLVNWPEPIKIMQRNWIGRSEGAEVDFSLCATGVPPVGTATPSFQEFAGSRTLYYLAARSFAGKNPYGVDENPADELMARIRHLPHVEVKGATYFATFHAAEGVSFTPDEKRLILQACAHWHGDKCCVYAAVVLGNHVHLLLRPCESGRLSKLLHSIKSFTAHEIDKSRGRSGTIWLDESFDHVVRNLEWFTAFVKYICDNPIKYGLASKPGDYPWLWVNPEEVFLQKDERAFGVVPGELRKVLDDGQETEEDRRDACPTITVFTTRPDTLFGATYMVLAPEHPLVAEITTPEQKSQVEAYVAQAARKSELERAADTKEKTGVFTGAYAINPANKKRIPVWVADYVMMGYGTGAIMAVPAHDERDWEFAATRENLKIVLVVAAEGQRWCNRRPVYLNVADTNYLHSPGSPDVAFRSPVSNEGQWIDFESREAALGFFSTRNYEIGEIIPCPSVNDGFGKNSGKYDGLTTEKFQKKITADLQSDGAGKAAVNYKLRDWLFSRQWYWGEPFPIVHCDECGIVPLGEDQLPLLLPDMEDFMPERSSDPSTPPRPPLEKAKDWVQTTCPRCGRAARRETNAMPQWAGSCWYYLRFLDPRNEKEFCGQEAERYWMAPAGKSEIRNPKSETAGGVDLYVGGAEHAVLHLLYARFWHKVLYDLGHVSSPEPFGKLFNQGMVRSFAYRDKRGVYVGYDAIDFREDGAYHKTTGEKLSESIEKMSKSLKNVVNPDDVIAKYGADTFRLYEMFMGPLESSKPWNIRDVMGVHRFLNRIWRMIVGDEDLKSLISDKPDGGLERSLHKLIKKVGEDVEAMKFNTAIAAMMEFVNEAFKAGAISTPQAERFVLVLAPFAPHIAEELWQRLGHDQSLAHEPWPEFDPAMVIEDSVEMPVQVGGKLRARITVPASASQDEVLAAALADPKVAALVAGKQIVKKIVVPGRLVNIVVK